MCSTHIGAVCINTNNAHSCQFTPQAVCPTPICRLRGQPVAAFDPAINEQHLREVGADPHETSQN